MGKISVVLMGIIFTLPVLADDALGSETRRVKTGLTTGWLGAKSGEYVYDPDSDKKISELQWKVNNAPIIQGDISWDALSWLTLGARGWTTLSHSGGYMDDYDWLTPGQSGWSHWSTHPNTRLNYGNEFDLSATGWLLNSGQYALGAVVGYQQTRFSWRADGGSFSYYNGEVTGEFPRDAPGIAYRQKFSTPYMGITGLYRQGNFELSGLIKFSPWAMGSNNDEHYARDLTFRDSTSHSRYYSATLDAGYYLTANAKVYTRLNYSRYSEGKGGMEVIDHAEGVTDYSGGNTAGSANGYYTVSAGLQYRF